MIDIYWLTDLSKVKPIMMGSMWKETLQNHFSKNYNWDFVLAHPLDSIFDNVDTTINNYNVFWNDNYIGKLI